MAQVANRRIGSTNLDDNIFNEQWRRYNSTSKKVGMIRERTEQGLQRFVPIIKYNHKRDDAIIIKPHCLILAKMVTLVDDWQIIENTNACDSVRNCAFGWSMQMQMQLCKLILKFQILLYSLPRSHVAWPQPTCVFHCWHLDYRFSDRT